MEASSTEAVVSPAAPAVLMGRMRCAFCEGWVRWRLRAVDRDGVVQTIDVCDGHEEIGHDEAVTGCQRGDVPVVKNPERVVSFSREPLFYPPPATTAVRAAA